MAKGTSLFAGLTALIAMGSAGADTPPCSATKKVADINDATGHYYEVYAADSITWAAAKACADAKIYQDIGGHLATLTSSGEDEWVDELREKAKLPKGQVWIGGSQQGSPNSPSPSPGDGWRWENGEGPFPGTNTETAFANWAAGEPNDGGGDLNENGQEQHLTLGRFEEVRGWNDEGVAPTSIGGFIVEYDLPRVATDCTLAGGCETVKGQTLTLPPGWVTAEDSIKFTAYEFTDRRICGQGELILFTDLNDGKPELRIPPYLCGSPKFVVVAVNVDNSAGLSFDRGGTVLIRNETATVLPGNDPDVVCKDTPIFPTNPQRQDVVVYQTTDPGRMLEDLPGNRGRDPQFAGAAGEFTNSCGSSRGTGKELSYFVVGMRIDFGASASNPAARHERFVALTLYKLSLLQQSVSLARSAGALKNGDATKMTAQLDNAVKKLGRGDPSGALGHVNQFLKFVAAARYTQLGLDNNYNGEHLMRGTNIEFTLRVKVIPYAP